MKLGSRNLPAWAREILLIDLVDHRVEDREREWWAQCKLHHTQAFPYFLYDMARTVAAIAVFGMFLPLPLTLMVIFTAPLIIARQWQLDRRTGNDSEQPVAVYRAMRELVVWRALFWSVITGIGLTFAPQSMLIGLVPAAMMIMFIDGVCMLAMPKRAMVAVSFHAAAIAIPLFLIGSPAAMIGALVAVCSLVYLHWGIFNLHYLFATRRLRTRRLGEAKETIELLLNQYDEDGSDWLIECDEEGRILRPNRRFCSAADKSAKQLDGLRLSLLFKDCPEREELRAIGDREENFRSLVIPLEVRGKDRWWSISARPIYSAEGSLECWRGFIADVTRTRQAEEKVSYMAHYDVLTNLPNRSLFNTTLRRAFDKREEDALLAVLYVDIDHFKTVNDTYGHSFGDKVLAGAARRLERAVDTQSMIARLAGDEFAVLLEEVDNRGEALSMAQKIVRAMDEPLTIEGRIVQFSVSVGVAFAPDNGRDGESVLRAADLALYDAKANGRSGASIFDPAMQEEAHERRTLELDLRAALGRGELEVHYQPLLDAQTSETVEYEALLRWNHPERGAISPMTFIPIAEETGQIVPIGAWVLREALNECARWPEHISVSVNLSPAQMRDEGLLNTIVGALAASGVAADRLELEITESLLMQENEATLALLHKIRELGVRIALDDFGTGYSSLNYLRSFPFDKIKIDRCFVRDLGEGDDSDAIVQAVVSLADKLRMHTTAEGVENEAQFELIKAAGCTQVQGFLFSKAKPASELPYGPTERGSDSAKVVSLKPGEDSAASEAQQRKAG